MSDQVTVASTTDSQEEVNRAAGLPADSGQALPAPKTTNAPASEAEPTPDSSTTVAEPDTADEEKEEVAREEEEEQPKVKGDEGKPKKGGFQKRIDKLTKRNYDLEENNSQLQQRLDAIERRLAGEKPAAEPATAAPAASDDPKPTQDQFKTFEEYSEARTRWDVRQELKSAREKEAQATDKVRTEETFKAYNRAASELRGVHEDFDEVVGAPEAPIPQGVQVAIISMRDKGPEIAYQLAKHPEFRAHLNAVNEANGPAAALVEFGGWVAALPGGKAAIAAHNQTVAAGTATAVHAPASSTTSSPEKPRVVSQAPEPIKPVGGASPKTAVKLEEADYQTFKKEREKAIRAARGR